MPTGDEPIFTRLMRAGFGLLAFGLGLMFLSGKVLPSPVPAGIATGILLGLVGLVLLIYEGVRE